MSLSRHLSSDRVIQEAREHAKRYRGGRETVHDMLQRGEASGHLHGSHQNKTNYDTDPIPKYRIPSKGTDARTAYDLVNSELLLDGNPQLNLASFVHTQMNEYADRLMFENRMKNQIDSDEYPGTTLIHNRLVSMVASLWHADDKKENATGCVTTGSSEAAQLGGLAMKKMWQARRKAAGKSWKEPGPNIVMGSNAQVALEKFARYFDVETRFVDVDESTKYVLDPKRAIELVDENTIGVYVILGSTYTGTYENVEEMSRLLDEYEARTSIYIPIHVDAASGGFVAPFASPSLKWDFHIPRVVSINSSGHKFGQSYVGCGFIIWRDKQHLPKELVFELHYLGSVEYSFSLNFSRPAAPFLAQYFNLLYLGFEGYRRVALNDLKNARLLARALERSKYYKVVSEVHHLKDKSLTEKAKETVGAVDDVEAYVPSLPVVAFMFSDEFRKEYPRIKQRSIQLGLREHNWIVPNYDLPPSAQDKEVLRVVIRENFNEDMVERLFHDIIEVTEQLMDEHEADVRQPGEGEGRNVNAPEHGKGKVQSVSERLAASHGEGTRPVGHDSVC